MSNLRELLNPETPASFPDQSIIVTESASTLLVKNSSNANAAANFDSHSNMDTPNDTHLDQISPLAEDYNHSPHENCPDSLDCLPDTNDRPQHTLPVILRCAILGSAKGRLTIRDIYAAMEKKYPYYRTAGPAWKQSVRHHLSLSRLFERKAKPVTEPGFGSYWTVNLDAPPGTKRPRKRGRKIKNDNSNQSCSSPSTETSTVTGRRGRPRKYAPQDFEFDPSLGLPSTSPLHVSPSTHPNPTLQILRGSFASFQPSVNDRSSQPYRLHSVQDLPSPRYESYAGENMYEANDQHGEQRSISSSDDEEDSNEHQSEAIIYPYSGDPRTLRPPNFSSVPVDPTLITSYNEPMQHISRLQEEVRELQRQVVMLSTTNASLENELNGARAEIVHLRSKSEPAE